ncbi:hypothetical protein SAMN05444339_10291 [Loktanella atrilutea]|uniref:LydA holin phage, holin superfamily III n=1 Tax=Loktanella atrilutea TaxID=366533 RepID=A0A1M4WEU7_LOKAT|nr:hypothetical protein [Loktanella atrilutea]SHE79744.1 hypothetical protein SAMN05444339_10291 [Loktanella atrilutea]
MNEPTILQAIKTLMGNSPEHLNALIISGAGGAYVRAVFAPQSSWRKRALEGTAGAVSAIFLGGVLGHLIDAITGAETYAYLAGGFIMGEGGIVAVQAVRRKFLGDEAK